MADEKLLRLRKWLLKERRFYMKLHKTAAPGSMGSERAWSEANVCSMTIARIDALLKEGVRRGR